MALNQFLLTYLLTYLKSYWRVIVTGRPPTIVDQSSGEMSYKVSEKVELVCVASGDPLPSYVILNYEYYISIVVFNVYLSELYPLNVK